MPDAPHRTRYPGIFEPVLERLLKEAPQLFSAPAVELLPESYEDRPYSHLLLAGVRPVESATPTSHVFVKISKLPSPDAAERMRARLLRDFQTTASVYEHLAASGQFGAVRPVACYAEQLAIVTERAQGRTLLDHLQAHSQWFPGDTRHNDVLATLENVGGWIKALQAFRPGASSVSIEGLREYVDLRLRRLVKHQTFTPSDRTRILDRLDGLGREIASDDLREVWIHADLAPSNVLVHGPSVVVLDFAMSARGHFLHDISRLAMQIDLLKAKMYRRSIVDVWKTALLRGIDPLLSPAHPLYRFSSILHRVNHLGSLSIRRERFPSTLFSRYLRHLHRQWLERELATPVAGRSQ